MSRHFALALLLLSAPALADIVHLKDGSQVEGKLQRDVGGGGWVVTAEDGKITKVGDDQVRLIQKTSSLSADQIADQKLAALRRVIDATGDPAQAIDRLNRFADQNPKTKAADAAKKEAAVWQDRLDRKLVLVGDKWITTEERDKMVGESAKLADQARELLKQNRQRDADAVVVQILSVDPSNVAGLYLKGLIAHKQGDILQAKRSFELLREKLPDHAPTLNNLGVILWQQKQALGALTLYDLAMAAAPRNRTILDNALEAINALKPSELKSTGATRAAKRVQEQDIELQKELAAQGLYRWGATYITEAQMAEVRKVQESIKTKLEALRQDWEKLTYDLEDIDRRIDANEDTMERIARDRIVSGTGVRTVQAPMPRIYYDLKRENDRLKIQAKEIEARLDAIPARKAQIEQESPHPAYTGVHRMIDVEGTPLPIAKSADK